ncbi:MAG: 2-phospho-L-lactate transferase [Hyphomicrobiaceae bacterium]
MNADASKQQRVVALSGGIGGAKLALGLKRVLPPDSLTIIANTGDDFEHMGLSISPDIDTLIYTLAGLSDTQRGWGRANETWTFMSAVQALGGETWFNLGDGDLAMHVQRTARLAEGHSLSTITADNCATLGVGALILPMSNQPVRTRLQSEEGWLDFQDYFVGRQAEPVVNDISYAGSEAANPAPGLIDVLTAEDVAAIIICPSNPLISIEPILAVPGVRQALRKASAPVIAVSPIIDGQSVKGPTAKMFRELGFAVSAATVLQRYNDILDAFIADPRDMHALETISTEIVLVPADIMMVTLDDRERLARTVMDVAQRYTA